MNIALKRLFLFVLINIVAFLILEISLSNYDNTVLVQDIFLQRSIQAFEDRAEEIDIIFLGDSQVFYGINPDAIKDFGHQIHNFAFPSEPLPTTFYKIKHYLDQDKLKNLKYAIIGLQYSSFTSDTRTSLNSQYNYSQFYDYWDILKNNNPSQSLIAILRSMDVIRLHRYYLDQEMHRDILTKEELLDNGYGKRDYALSQGSLDAETEYLRQNLDLDMPPDPVPLSYCKRLIDLLHKADVKVLFIQMPTPRILVAKDINDPYNVNFQRFLANQFSGVLVLNYDDNVGWQRDYFSDRGHLNFKGSFFLGQLINKSFLNRMSHKYELVNGGQK